MTVYHLLVPFTICDSNHLIILALNLFKSFFSMQIRLDKSPMDITIANGDASILANARDLRVLNKNKFQKHEKQDTAR